MPNNRLNPELHHRKSIRLKGYDYSLETSYFITICTQNREDILGEIDDKKIILNNAGNMVEGWLIGTKNKFNNILINEYVIMPNHLHCIISLTPVGADTQIPTPVGADLCVCPDCPDNAELNRADTQVCPYEINTQVRPCKLFEIIQWFKTMTTNEYIKGVKNGIYPAFNKRIWQRNYYERIIRNEAEFNAILEYIRNNPTNWLTDENNIKTARNGATNAG